MNAADLYTAIALASGQEIVVTAACAARGFCPADGSCPCPDASASVAQQVVQAKASVFEAVLIGAVSEAAEARLIIEAQQRLAAGYELEKAGMLAEAESEAALRRVGGMPGVHDHENGYGPCSCTAGEARLELRDSQHILDNARRRRSGFTEALWDGS